MKEEYRKQIIELLEMESLHLYEVCQKAIGILKEAEDLKLFCFFVDGMCELRTQRYIELTDDLRSQIEKSNDEYGDMWNEVVKVLFRKQLSQERFYEELWGSIAHSTVLGTNEDQAYALYIVCMNPSIPYYQPRKVIRMENAEFAGYVKKLDEKFKETRCMITYPFAQRTERAAALLAILENCSDDKEKTVVLAHIMDCADAIARVDGQARMQEP